MYRKLLRYLSSIGILLALSFYVKGVPAGELQLTNIDSKIIILSPANLISDAIFEVDTTITELTLESISTVNNLEVSLILPNGQSVNPINLASGITYNQVTLDAPLKLPIPTVFTLGGTHYRYTLSQPIVGTYTIHVDGTNKVNIETPVIINMI